MKIIFFNIWNGKFKDGVVEFIREQSHSTDVFCLQEAFSDMREVCRDILPDFIEFHVDKFVTEPDDFAQVIYVRRNLQVKSCDILLADKPSCGPAISVELLVANKSINICNFHGMSRPVDKLDDTNRLAQSMGMIEFFKKKAGMKIIGGDFNLFPDTKSVQLFAENSYRNLIKDFAIKTTRNKIAWEKFPDNPHYYSDYVFLSPDIKLNNFAVIDNEISDHLPLIVEVEI